MTLDFDGGAGNYHCTELVCDVTEATAKDRHVIDRAYES